MPDAFEKAPGVELRPTTPETTPESERVPVPEQAPAPERRVAETTPVPVPPTMAPVAPVAPPDPVMHALEGILSEDLFDFYRSMPPDLQVRFKTKGDEVAGKIRQMLLGAMIKAKEILKLVSEWLKLIPGVNKFFLEQESKIKTDKIVELHKREFGE